MTRSVVSTENAPAAIGPYSQCITFNNIAYISGQIPLDKATGEVVLGDVEAQMRLCMDNLMAVVEAAGSAPNLLLKTTIFLTDISHFSRVNAVYAQYFPESPPARSCIAVSALPKGVSVEVEAVAALKR